MIEPMFELTEVVAAFACIDDEATRTTTANSGTEAAMDTFFSDCFMCILFVYDLLRFNHKLYEITISAIKGIVLAAGFINLPI